MIPSDIKLPKRTNLFYRCKESRQALVGFFRWWNISTRQMRSIHFSKVAATLTKKGFITISNVCKVRLLTPVFNGENQGVSAASLLE